MDKQITRIVGGLLICFMFFGSYLHARRGLRGHGGRGRYHRPYYHRRYHGPSHWGHRGWGDWGWWLAPTLAFTFAASRSDQPKEDPLKSERDQALNAIANYENVIDTLETTVGLLKQSMSYYTPPAATQTKYYETDRLITDYTHQISILDLKLDLVTTRINTASANKSTQKALNDIVITAQKHQAEIAVLKAEVDMLIRDVSSLNMKNQQPATQILDRMRLAIQYHINKIKQFIGDIERLTKRL